MFRWEYIGYFAAIMGSVSLIPEVIKALRTHHLQDLAWGMMFLMCSSTICWGLYAVHTNDIPLMLSSTANISAEITLTILKLYYRQKKKPLFEKPEVDTDRPFVADYLRN